MNIDIEDFKVKQVYIAVQKNMVLNDSTVDDYKIIGVYDNKNQIPHSIHHKIIGPVPYYCDVFKPLQKDTIPDLKLTKEIPKKNFYQTGLFGDDFPEFWDN